MRGANKRNMRDLTDAYWSKYWDAFPYYPHQLTWYRKLAPSGEYSILDLPKLKKNRFYPKEFNFYTGCPKAWNKMFHIRPVRRENKYWAKMACTLDLDLMYLAEEKCYPNYKMHVYYY